MTSGAPTTPRTRTTAAIRALRFDAGSLALDLVATVGRRPSSPVERLGDLDRLHAWCDGVGLELRTEDAGPDCLAALHGLRTAAYDVVACLLDGRAPRTESVDLLNRLAGVEPPPPGLRIDAGGRPRSATGPLTAPALLSLVARDAIALVTDPRRRDRLRTCDSEICRMVYLDTLGGKPRKWCSMQRCGNSAKAARHRRKAEETG